MPEKMRHGNIKCSCGKDFYFETVREFIHCIQCDEKHDVREFTVKVEEPETLEDPQIEG